MQVDFYGSNEKNDRRRRLDSRGERATLPVFFLHTRKYEEQTIQPMPSEYYQEIERSNPAQLIKLKIKQFNDNLNNYRIPLGKL